MAKGEAVRLHIFGRMLDCTAAVGKKAIVESSDDVVLLYRWLAFPSFCVAGDLEQAFMRHQTIAMLPQQRQMLGVRS